MYTVVPRAEVKEHRPRPGEPALEIIDHREQPPSRLTSKKKKRPEQLPYDSLKQQRDSMFQKELKYKKRIEELEKDSSELVKTYENTYEENIKLKRILDNGPDAVKLKQLAKTKSKQKGVIDTLKDENETLAKKLADLEKDVLAERLQANDRSWDVQLAKVKKKRDEEDSIPTEGPFVAGKLVKRKRLMLTHGDGGEVEEHDAYDLQVDSLEKETQVLLNKVRILKREKEQIDYATVMGKGAVTKNKAVAKAINDKLNRDLNKFVIRLQMLKMKQNAARTYFSVMTDESNPVIQLKPTEIKSGRAGPDASNRDSRSRRSWKRQEAGAPTPKALESGRGSKTKTVSNLSKKQEAGSQLGSSILHSTKGKEHNSKQTPTSLTSRENSEKENTMTKNKTTQPKCKSSNPGSKQPSRKNSLEVDAHVEGNPSARIWNKVQSSKLISGTKTNDAVIEKKHRQSDPKSKADKASKRPSNDKTVVNDEPVKTTSGVHTLYKNMLKSDSKPNEDNTSKHKTDKSVVPEIESTGRYSHGPEPIGRKGIVNKKLTKHDQDQQTGTKITVPKKPRVLLKPSLYGGGAEDHSSVGQGHTYRINGPDDGYSLIRLHDQATDRGVRAKPVPIHFKTRKSFDVRENRSIIGNTGIRNDAFYKQLNDEDPYFGL